MKKISCCILILLASSCIPLKIAPNIEGEKIVNAKKFKKDLPNFQGFIFEDTKNANEFYNFINTKYDLKHSNVESNVPISINNKTYYLSFFERERTTKTLNLIPLVVDAGLDNKGVDPLFKDLYTSRSGFWYLILTVTDPEIKDCLNPSYPQHQEILNHLKNLKTEYFSTSNYLESYLKMI
jgi:hypothetical protein